VSSDPYRTTQVTLDDARATRWADSPDVRTNWVWPDHGVERRASALRMELRCTLMARASDLLKGHLLLSAAMCAFIGPAAGTDYSEPLDRSPASSCLVAQRVCTTVWTGFYAGGNAGYTFGANESTTSTLNTFVTAGAGPLAQAIATLANFTMPSSNDGFIGGGQLGYNVYQGTWFGTSFVAGVETDIQAGPGKASSNSVTAVPLAGFPNKLSQTTSVSSGVDYLGTLRARLGIVVGLPETTVLQPAALPMLA
jgi:hypothetical protein